ncbi:type II toxin-antitoxin system PemK/MazF family toxin [Micromonospora sp. NPDC000207]|uniref:type II toxin-antitoxin system PemK/MazF family toxin n=1 Tax=Micromonospora sp. NPDC000207 TaxID=3154246 RepID=UPI003324AD7D
MRDWLLWAALILLAVTGGWAWDAWRHASGRRSRPGRGAAGRAAGPKTRGRQGSRPGKAPRPRGTERSGTGTVRPGEIWWADVPYVDGTGSKVRPCLVLGTTRDRADVLKITSQDKSHRDDHVPIPTRDWHPQADRDSYLDLGEPIRVELAAFRDRAGRCDPTLWQEVRALPHLAPQTRG